MFAYKRWEARTWRRTAASFGTNTEIKVVGLRALAHLGLPGRQKKMYITGYKMVLDLMQKRPEMAEEKKTN